MLHFVKAAATSTKITNACLNSLAKAFSFPTKSLVTQSRNQTETVLLRFASRKFSATPESSKSKEFYEKVFKVPSFRINNFKLKSSKQAQVPKEQESLLDQLKTEADRDPTNEAKQLAYYKKLNELGLFEQVLSRFESKSFATSADIREEFLKAFFIKYPEIKPKFYPTGSPENPVIVKFLEGVNINEPRPSLFVRIGRFSAAAVSVGASLVIILFFGAQFLDVGSKNKGGRSGGGGGYLSELFASTYHVAELSDITFADVKGNEEAKEELSDIVLYLKNPENFVRLGAKLPKGVLLTGPPGCGKTMIAKALAGEANCSFYYASGSEFEEMLVGVGARRMRALFEQAKKTTPCIIFIDEIDAIGGKRDSLDNRGGKMTLNQLLVELDGFAPSAPIVVVAATNLPDVLDPALIRPGRFDRKVSILPPGLQARKEIFESNLKNKKGIDVDMELLAKSSAGFTGADIANMVNIATIQAVKQKADKVSMPMLMSAMDDVMMGPSRKSMDLSAETKKITAYHEGAHALVSLHKGLHQISKVTVLPRGHALGYVSYFHKDEHLISKETFLAELDTAMAGRVAEEMIFGPNKVTGGAGSDFEGATKKAYHMVIQLGFSEKLGPFAVNHLDKLSPDMRAIVDREVSDMLTKSYARTKQLLMEHRSELDLLANALLKHETLTEEEVKAVIQGKDVDSFRAQRAKEHQDKERERQKNMKIPVSDANVSASNH